MPVSERTPIGSPEDLGDYYRSLNREKNLYIGIELEQFGIYRDSLKPVAYEGDAGYLAVYKKLAEEVGWEVIDGEGEHIYELQRGDTRITIEGDGRPELSGSPKEHLHDLTREFRLHNNELIEIGNVFNIAWLPVGWQPIHRYDEIPILEKTRYQIYSEECGEWGKEFLNKNNGYHVNVSFTDEQNALAKAQTLFRTMPIMSAMFACGPFSNGELSGYLNTRRHWFTRVSPVEGRSGMPSTFLDPSFSFEEWVEYHIDYPLILVKQENGDDLHPRNMTFRDWMEQGFDDRKPTPYDFDQHIKTIWSPMRLRPSYLEHRVADSVPFRLAMSLPALIKGLVFSSESWEAVAELTKDWTADDILDADERSHTTGLGTEVRGRTLLTYAQELITIANEQLHTFERIDAQDDDESVYLTPLKEQIFIKEKSPAEELVELYEGEWNGDLSRIVEWCEGE